MRPLRIPWVQAALAWVLAEWMRLCFATIRWTYENQGVAEEIWARGGGVHEFDPPIPSTVLWLKAVGAPLPAVFPDIRAAFDEAVRPLLLEGWVA